MQIQSFVSLTAVFQTEVVLRSVFILTGVLSVDNIHGTIEMLALYVDSLDIRELIKQFHSSWNEGLHDNYFSYFPMKTYVVGIH